MAGISDRVVVWIALEPSSPEGARHLEDAMLCLTAEDPHLRTRSGEAGQTIVAGISEAHLESAIDRLRRTFNVAAAVGKVQVAYREALTAAADGEGRFVRHAGGRAQYAHVKIRVHPLPQGSGFRFATQLRSGAIPERFIEAAATGIQNALSRGVVAGSPVDDVSVQLIDASYQERASSETAFKIAGGLAFSDAARRALPVLTEPVMRLEITLPQRCLDAIIADLTRRDGNVEARDAQGDTQIVRARMPLRGLLGYEAQFLHMTAGRGRCSIVFDCYEPVPPTAMRGAPL